MSCPTHLDDVRARTLAVARALVHGHDRLQAPKQHDAGLMLPAPTDRIESDVARGGQAQRIQHATRAILLEPEGGRPSARSAYRPEAPTMASLPPPDAASCAGGQPRAGSPSSRSRAAAYGATGVAGRTRGQPQSASGHHTALQPATKPDSSTQPARSTDAAYHQPPMRLSQGDGAWRKHHTVFTNAKAGMDKVDHDHVQRIVYEMSKVRGRNCPFVVDHVANFKAGIGCLPRNVRKTVLL